jgi:hypothetical protein
MKPSGPLTEMEKRVFGENAVRGPDGVPIERGIGSKHHAARVAKQEAAIRSGRASHMPEPSDASEPELTVDLRAVHPFPAQMQ